MDKLTHMLYAMGIAPNLRGFDITIAAIDWMIDHNNIHPQLTKVLYPHIATQLDMTPVGVERGLRYAISKAIYLDHKEIQETIGISPYKNRLTNSEFLCALYRALKEEK